MAYVTGTANSMTDLLTALQNACMGNGWTLSGSVLHKGNCFASVVAGTSLLLVGGTGIDGSNALTTPTPSGMVLGRAIGADAVAFPLTYHVHVLSAPDEVYLLVNYSGSIWQWLAFGCSPVAGLPGTGNWCGASGASAAPTQGVGISPADGGNFNNASATSAALFWSSRTLGANWINSFFHHALDGSEWSGYLPNSPISSSTINAAVTAAPLIARQPNAWNGETSLCPVQPYLQRASNKTSMVGDLGHARFLRNDNLADGEIIPLGSDKWKSYPWYKKNAAARDGSSFSVINHSGTMGWAIRYDGP